VDRDAVLRVIAVLHWIAVGFMLAFGTVAILSIGAPFFLIGLVLLGVMLRRGPGWPAGLGALTGAGMVGVVIGLIGAVADPGIWGASGISLIALSGTAFWWLRCRKTF
jgi:hypothetical protein